MPSPPGVTVIMPTCARPERAESLLRAIDSAVSQRDAGAVPVVVVNGRLRDRALLRSLARRHDVRVVTLDEASLPAALRVGRSMVETPYFTVLDDDDLLLDGALAARLAALAADPALDVVVTNGWEEGGGRRELRIADVPACQADPLGALMRRHWLAPCAGLFRTGSMPRELFERIPAYLEWTYLGIHVSLRCRIRFLEDATYVYRTDTPASLSKSPDNVRAQPAAVARLLELDVPADVRARLEAALTMALHCVSSLELDDGRVGAAWRWHLRALPRRRGWRHLAYTRRLISATCRAVWRSP